MTTYVLIGYFLGALNEANQSEIFRAAHWHSTMYWQYLRQCSGVYATYAQETCRGTVRIPNREERGERRHILPAQSSTLIVFYDSIIATDRASRCPAQKALPHNKEK